MSLAVAPQLQRAAAVGGPSFVSLSKVVGTLTAAGGGKTYTVEAPFIRDTATLSFNVTFAGPTQQYTLALAATDTVGDTLFKSTREITATPGTNAPLQDILSYVAPDTAVRFLSVALSDTALMQGDSLTLSAIGYDSFERRVTPLYIGWTTRDATVASVSSRGPSSARIFGGSIEGDVWVVGRAFNGTADSVLVPVRLKVGSVVLSTDTLRLVTGAVATLSADVRGTAGASLDRPVAWRSLDTTVATVVGYLGGVVNGQSVTRAAVALALGQVVGIRPGTTKIVATSGAKADTTIVVVAQVPVAGISISPDTLPLLLGQQARFAAVTLDASGNLLTGRTIAWSTSNALVATVGADGMVTGLGVGIATVTASSEGVTASARVRVDAAASAIARTVVTPDTVRLDALGAVAQLVARSYAPDSSLVAGSYRYAVNGPAGIVSVDGFGQVTALALGTTSVVVTENGGTADTATVLVTQLANRVQLSQPVQLDALGMLAIFHATVYDAAGAPIANAPLNWTVENAGVGTIVAAAGDSIVVRASGNGTTPVDATSGNATGSSTLSVIQVAKSATLSPNALVLGLDGRARLTPRLFDGGGSPMAFVEKDVQWVIAGVSGVAEVDSTGEIHARALGATGVYAVVQGVKTPTTRIDVSDAALPAIIFSTDTLLVDTNGARVSVYLSISSPTTVTVVLSDPAGLVKFDKDTLIFDQGRTNRDVTISGLTDGKTTIVASDVGKVFASDSMAVFLGKVVSPPVIVGRVTAVAGGSARAVARPIAPARATPRRRAP